MKPATDVSPQTDTDIRMEADELPGLRRDLAVLFGWCAILFLCAGTLRQYHYSGTPPFWDNLAYQLDGLRLVRHWLDGGDWGETFRMAYESHAIAHSTTLAASFVLFGLNPSSPYFISALFGYGSVAIVYLLARELGAARATALWGALLLSVLPSFIYQNFLQTRNDFQAAFFVTLSWLLFIRAHKRDESKLAFWGGFWAGVGTLFKVSIPGYVIWGMVFYCIPLGQGEFGSRLKRVAIYAAAAMLACGWYYLPNLLGIIEYYESWRQAEVYQAAQYGLDGQWSRSLFYLRNLIQTHLGTVPAALLAGAAVIATGWRLLIARQGFALSKLISFVQQNGIILVLVAAVSPLIFLTLRGSLSSLGDVPILLLMVAASISLSGLLVPHGKRFSVSHAAAILPVLLLTSLSNLPLVEKEFHGESVGILATETRKIRDQIGLRDEPMQQVFSHPAYNASAIYWQWLIDANPYGDRPSSYIKGVASQEMRTLFPEKPELIARKLERFPLLIISDKSGTAIRGESFHTFNRLHAGIMAELEKNGRYIWMHEVSLEEGQFPVHFAVRKDYAVFRPTRTTADNWVEWNGKVEYFALQPTQLRWRGVPARPIDKFWLRSTQNPATVVQMKLNRVLSDGVHEYLSESSAPPSERLTTYALEAPPDITLTASEADQRKLAFYKVESNALTSR